MQVHHGRLNRTVAELPLNEHKGLQSTRRVALKADQGMGGIGMPKRVRMDLDFSPLAGLADDSVEALVVPAIAFPGLVEEQRLLRGLAQRGTLATHLRHIAIEFGHELAADVNISRLAALGHHAAAVERIEPNAQVAFGSSGLVRVENIGQREGGDFLAAQTRMQRQAHHYPVMGVLRCDQERLDISHAQELGQGLGYAVSHRLPWPCRHWHRHAQGSLFRDAIMFPVTRSHRAL